MQVHRSPKIVEESLRLPASACAIGMFDGVHTGHRMVLENALRQARILDVPSAVVSFATHPQQLISRTPTELLSSLEERLAAFEAMGFDRALILDFNEWLKNLPAEDFVQQVLIGRLGVKSVTVGYDHRFGRNRAGNGELLKTMGQQLGFDVHIIAPIRTSSQATGIEPATIGATGGATGETAATTTPGGGQIVSSTLIRKLLAYGDIEQANRLLGRPYMLSGTVEGGMQRGRQLGFPTANLAIEPYRLIPVNGTYGGEATLNGVTYPAVCNAGLSPTFGDQARKRVEVHLLGYDGPDFYGARLTMHFHYKIRDELRFPTLDALITQIHTDCQAVQTYQANLPPQA